MNLRTLAFFAFASGSALALGACGSGSGSAGMSGSGATAGSGGSGKGGTGGTGATGGTSGSAGQGTGGTGTGGSAGQGTGGTGTGGSAGQGTGGSGGQGTGGMTGGTEGPSCNGLTTTCGPTGGSCCASSVVSGGTFYRNYDAVTFTDKSKPATVSDFRMDTYEITVGRFRKFVAAYPGSKPSAGAGKNPNNPSDPGWDAAWNAAMPADQASLTAALKCDATWHTWTDIAGPNESRPINCISWYEAFAFCIWDGGRLPTEAEWNYAAAGGSEQRAYPWSVPPTSMTIDPSYAVYLGSGSPANVGSKSPKGDGKWGQSDLAGNVWEWVLDKSEWGKGIYPNPCINCANLSVGQYRAFRGGSFDYGAEAGLASGHDQYDPANRYMGLGARCVRIP